MNYASVELEASAILWAFKKCDYYGPVCGGVGSGYFPYDARLGYLVSYIHNNLIVLIKQAVKYHLVS